MGKNLALPQTTLCALFLTMLAAFAPAQVPAHAALLTPTGAMDSPVIAQQGDDVHVFGFDGNDLVHAASFDGGRTWPITQQVIDSFSHNDFLGALAIEPGVVMIAAQDLQTGPRLWRSTDRGATWAAPTQLDSTAPTPWSLVGASVVLTANGSSVCAIWNMNSATDNVAARCSFDGGATWQAVQALANAPTEFARAPLTSRNGDVIDVLWTRQSAAPARQRSTDGGATWLASPATLPTAATLVAAGNGTDLFSLSPLTNVVSHDAGQSWQPLLVPGLFALEHVAVEGDLVAIVGRADASLAPTYVVNVSTDGGLSWQQNPLSLPSPVFFGTELFVQDGVVFLRFFSHPSLDLVVSRDQGASWQLVDGPMDVGFAVDASRTVHLTADPAAPTDLYVFVGAGSTTPGPGTPGTGGRVPQLATTALPLRGAQTSLRVTDAVGGSLGAIAVSFAAPLPLPLGSATVWPTVSPLLFAFPTGGAPGQAGDGAFALPLTVPMSSAVIGASLTSQALVLDAGSPDGFAVSNALETWLR
ncbi:MAG: exo-alpha-sialidase [Planctomycetota bacterium]